MAIKEKYYSPDRFRSVENLDSLYVTRVCKPEVIIGDTSDILEHVYSCIRTELCIIGRHSATRGIRTAISFSLAEKSTIESVEGSAGRKRK